MERLLEVGSGEVIGSAAGCEVGRGGLSVRPYLLP